LSTFWRGKEWAESEEGIATAPTRREYRGWEVNRGGESVGEREPEEGMAAAPIKGINDIGTRENPQQCTCPTENPSLPSLAQLARAEGRLAMACWTVSLVCFTCLLHLSASLVR
jgi:hypothetical protein